MADSRYFANTSTRQFPKRAMVGTLLSGIGGAVILLQGLLILLYSEGTTFLGLETELRPTVLFGLGLGLLGVFGIAIGVSILAGAYMIYTPGLEILGGAVVLIFSVLSIVIGGGWILGLAFGMLGGIPGLFRK